MTGYEDFNYPAFATAEEDLAGRGFEVVSPHRNGLPIESPWETHVRADIVAMLGCNAVVTLPGWERSRGARVETNLARELGMPVLGWPFAIPTVEAERFLCGVGVG